MSTVYALIDPRDGVPHYVGATVRYRRRIQLHRNASRRVGEVPKYEVTKWQRELFLAGLDFREIVLEETDEATLPLAESFWIAQGRGLGWPLTNETKGGRGSLGFRHDHDSLRAMRARAAARPRDFYRLVADALRGRKAPETVRAKMSASHSVPLMDDRGQFYASAKAAIAALGCRRNDFFDHIKGRAASVAGRTFRRLR